MNWDSVRHRWDALRCLRAHRGEVAQDKPRNARKLGCEYLRRRCGASRDEANRKLEEWIRDPGVLDDWNDTRAILDM